MLVIGFVLIFLGASAQGSIFYPYDSIPKELPKVIYYDFVDDVQLIEVDHLGAYWHGVHMADMAYPRALSAAVDVPKPVSNEYYVRDTLGHIIKSYSSHHSLSYLDSLFAEVPLDIHASPINEHTYFSISNKFGGIDRVDFYGDWRNDDLAYGLINGRGEQVLPTDYQLIQITNGGFNLMKDGQWGLMNQDFKMLTEFKYDMITTYPFEDAAISEITYFKKENKYSAFRVEGREEVIEVPLYENLSTSILFIEHEYLLFSSNRQRGLIDFKGEVMLPAEYDYIFFTNDTNCIEVPCVKLVKGAQEEYLQPEDIRKR